MNATRHKIKTSTGDYIKAVIAGNPVQPPKGKYETLIALYSAKAAIGCVTGRDTIASQRVRAEVNRVTAEGFEWSSQEVAV